jgi:hypothetical protein
MDTTQPVKYTTLGRVPPAGASGVFRGSCGGRLQNADNSSTAGAGILAYEAWLGHDVSYVIDYITTVPTTWAQFENAYCDQNDPTFKYISQWDWLSQPGRWTMMLGVPTCCGVTTGSGARTWAQEAAGDSDEHWTALGNNLVSWGMGNAVLRIGREWNGNWYNWSPCKTGDSISEYILGNMHIVDVLREVPGQSFQFMWNPTLGMVSGESGSNAEATKWYPGSNYVDIVGLDYYDFSSNSNYPTQTHTPYGNRSAASQAANFNYVYNQDDGFLGWINFAKWVGKPFALPEWGLELWLSGGNYSGGGDNDYFINQMASICKGTSMQAMWEDTGEGLYDTDSCPRRTSGLTVDASRNLYLEKFGGATPSLGRLTVDDSGDGNVTGGVGGSGDDDAPPIYPSGGTTCEIAWNVDVPVSVTPAPAAWDTYQRVTVTGSSTFNEVQRPGLIYLAAWNTYTYPGPVEFAVAWNVAGYDGEEQIQLMGSDMMKEME